MLVLKILAEAVAHDLELLDCFLLGGDAGVLLAQRGIVRGGPAGRRCVVGGTGLVFLFQVEEIVFLGQAVEFVVEPDQVGGGVAALLLDEDDVVILLKVEQLLLIAAGFGVSSLEISSVMALTAPSVA